MLLQLISLLIQRMRLRLMPRSKLLDRSHQYLCFFFLSAASRQIYLNLSYRVLAFHYLFLHCDIASPINPRTSHMFVTSLITLYLLPP